MGNKKFKLNSICSFHLNICFAANNKERNNLDPYYWIRIIGSVYWKIKKQYHWRKEKNHIAFYFLHLFNFFCCQSVSNISTQFCRIIGRKSCVETRCRWQWNIHEYSGTCFINCRFQVINSFLYLCWKRKKLEGGGC